MPEPDPVDELFAQPPVQFVGRRDELAKAAKAAGDAEGAAALRALRRPTVGAWLANLLAREHRTELEQLVDIGSLLRLAQDDLDPEQLRDLGRQRHRVVAALVALARRRAAELGHPASAAAADELEATLTAAVADPMAAEQLLGGRLTTGLSYAGLGFGDAAVPRAPAGRPAGGQGGARTVSRVGPAPSPGDDGAPPRRRTAAEAKAEALAAKVDAAERDLAQARLQAADAEAHADDAGRQVDGAAAVLATLQEEVVRVQSELDAAKAAVAAAQDSATQAAKVHAAAVREATTAQRRAEKAAQVLAALQKP